MKSVCSKYVRGPVCSNTFLMVSFAVSFGTLQYKTVFRNQSSTEHFQGFRDKSQNRYIKNVKYLEKSSLYPTTCNGKFCPSVGNTRVNSLRFLPYLRLDLVSSYLSFDSFVTCLFSFVSCLFSFVTYLFSFRILTDSPHRWRQNSSPLSTFFWPINAFRAKGSPGYEQLLLEPRHGRKLGTNDTKFSFLQNIANGIAVLPSIAVLPLNLPPSG